MSVAWCSAMNVLNSFGTTAVYWGCVTRVSIKDGLGSRLPENLSPKSQLLQRGFPGVAM